MDISGTFGEDLAANAVLGVAMVIFFCARDFCKRISHSDCAYDQEHGGLRIKLPTYRERPDVEDGTQL